MSLLDLAVQTAVITKDLRARGRDKHINGAKFHRLCLAGHVSMSILVQLILLYEWFCRENVVNPRTGGVCPGLLIFWLVYGHSFAAQVVFCLRDFLRASQELIRSCFSSMNGDSDLPA